ncbi:MAG: hypothetical protein QOC59_1611 [Microbacteriaceae bacterium]|jgi:hypothetical protein|nr:hypothetical protein [Microbacteriaceae bacterium]
MLFSLVWVLAGITAWCVASLALALIVGPMVRASDQADRAARRARILPLGSQVQLNR